MKSSLRCISQITFVLFWMIISLNHVFIARATNSIETSSTSILERSNQPGKSSITLESISFSKADIVVGLSDPVDVFVADIDGDGDVDLLSASTQDNQVLWWENLGYPTFVSHLITDTLNYAGPVSAADLDNDGDTDLLAASASGIDGGPLTWWENDGSQNFAAHILKYDLNKVSHVSTHDLDNDGDQDILVADMGDGDIFWWENDGMSNFTEHAITRLLNSPTDIFPADLDQDGDWDLLTTEWGANRLSWWENDGTENFNQRVISQVHTYGSSVAAGDLDGDGDLDVVGAFGHIGVPYIYWWENSGDEYFTRHDLATLLGAKALALADIDQDLDLDVIAAGEEANQVVWWQNDGLGKFNQYTIGNVGGPKQVQVADFDGDLDLDLVTANFSDHSLVGWLNNSPLPVALTANFEVEIREHGFQPGTLVVAEGTQVAWTNLGIQDHTVTPSTPSSDYKLFLPLVMMSQNTASTAVSQSLVEWGSTWLAPGDEYAFTFDQAGTYEYYSQANPQETLGTVIVISPDETVSGHGLKDTGLSVSTPSGASLEIPSANLLGDVDGTLLSTSNPQLEQATGAPLSMAYDFQVKDFSALVSGTVTLTLPYDPGQMPLEADEARARAAFFNGRSWISVPATVDTTSNRVIVESDHLSWWEVIWPCDEPFGLSDAQELAYDEARNYLAALADHQDLFEALTTSNGDALFELNASGADWLARQSLCDLQNAGSSGIQRHLGIDRTPEQVADAMVSLGEGLLTQEYSSVIGAQIWEAVSTANNTAQLTINLVEVAAFGGLGGFVGDLLVDSFVDLFVTTTYNVYWDLLYVGDVTRDFESQNIWLSSDLTKEVGQSELNRVLAYQVETNSGLCQLPYTPSSKGFFHTWAYGNFQDASDPSAAGFYNLYQRGSEVYLVLGLQDMSSFFDTLYGIIGYDRTDKVIALIEYEGGDEVLRVARLVLHNSRTLPICLIGKITLPEIRPGSPVQIRYYFVEDGHLDQRFDADGVQQIVAEAQPICNGSCNNQVPNQPPNQPAQPEPPNEAIAQDTGVDLSWIGGDLDGDAVTYDIYFEANNSTPNVLIAGNQSSTYLDPGPLSANTIYYWQVIARDAFGARMASPVWSFNTAADNSNNSPYTPSNPLPANAATFQPIETDLSWSSGDPDGDTVTFDIYFEANNPSPVNLVTTDRVGMSFDPGTLLSGTHYYWKVVARDEHGRLATSPIWDFITTAEVPLPLDFSTHVVQDDYLQILDLVAIDLDEDGDRDIVGVAYYEGKISWWENDGSESFTRHDLPDWYLGGKAVDVADLDQDGDLDVVGISSYSVVWWENDGSEIFLQHTIATGFYDLSDVAVVDLNGDNELDIVVADWFYSPTGIRWLENDGKETFSEHIIESDIRSEAIFPIDLDGDNHPDIIGAMDGSSLAWWQNDGAGNFTRHNIEAGRSYIKSLFSLDLDGDTDIDILCACSDKILWWENNGSQMFTKHVIADSLAWAYHLYPVNLDGDNDIDILGAMYSGDLLLFFENDGSQNFTQHTLKDQFDGAAVVIATDLDDDLDMDVIAADFDQLIWLEREQ